MIWIDCVKYLSSDEDTLLIKRLIFDENDAFECKNQNGHSNLCCNDQLSWWFHQGDLFYKASVVLWVQDKISLHFQVWSKIQLESNYTALWNDFLCSEKSPSGMPISNHCTINSMRSPTSWKQKQTLIFTSFGFNRRGVLVRKLPSALIYFNLKCAFSS